MRSSSISSLLGATTIFTLLTISSSSSSSAVAAPTPEQPTNPWVLLLTSSPPDTLFTPSCLKASYHGSYGSVAAPDHIYITRDDCINHAFLASGHGFLSGHINALSQQDTAGVLVWVGEAGVEDSSRPGDDALPMDGAWEYIESIASGSALVRSDDQATFTSTSTSKPSSPLLVAQTSHSLILSFPVDLLPLIDTYIPRHLSAVVINQQSPVPVPASILEHLRNITHHLTFDPKIDKIVNDGVDDHQLVRDIRWLTGESSDLVSRHSFHTDALKAAAWIRAKVQDTGAECTLQPFLSGFAPNIICTYPHLDVNSTEMVILSAHYDSRGSFGRLRGPGGDDDGSGSGHVLGIAQGIFTQKVRFHKSVTLAFFAGEEQGLLGSAAYARSLYQQNRTVLMHTQADMLGYHDPKEPMQLAFPATIGTPEVAYLLGNISSIYSPELVVGTTAACCSDHQSFLPYGFPATQVFERNGPIIDPMYHNSGDVSMRDGYDFDQIKSIAKVTFAGLLEVAGYEVGK